MWLWDDPFGGGLNSNEDIEIAICWGKRCTQVDYYRDYCLPHFVFCKEVMPGKKVKTICLDLKKGAKRKRIAVLTDRGIAKKNNLEDMKMNVGGVTTDYLIGYEARRTQRATSETSFASAMGKTAKVNGGQGFTLHWFDNEEGDKAIGACGLNGGSATVYKPADFDPEKPVYKVKVWDAAGNVTEERMVDVSKVDPQNSDFIDMLAYSGHLADSGECPGAFSAFIESTANPHGPGSVYDSYLDKMDWKSIVKYVMQLQYDLGNISGYMSYKKFWDFLEQ